MVIRHPGRAEVWEAGQTITRRSLGEDQSMRQRQDSVISELRSVTCGHAVGKPVDNQLSGADNRLFSVGSVWITETSEFVGSRVLRARPGRR